MQKASEMKVENLDHLGLIASLIDEIGIIPKINELVGKQPGEIVSPGLVVKAMIINGLGFEINTDTSHLDSSSFHLHGKYEQELPSVSFSRTEMDGNQSDNSSINYQTSPIPIQITYGYSCDHRPDLKQFILDLKSFQSIHAVAMQGIQQVSNLTSERLAILNLFPVTCHSYSNPK